MQELPGKTKETRKARQEREEVEEVGVGAGSPGQISPKVEGGPQPYPAEFRI